MLIKIKILLLIAAMGACSGCAENVSTSNEMRPGSPMVNSETKSNNGVTKMIFIHHSVGGHWLEHDNGNLVKELNNNGIYVNDITYEWEPKKLTAGSLTKAKRKLVGLLKMDKNGAYGIGDRTDIGQMYDWFIGPDAEMIMRAVYNENSETDRFGNHANNKKLATLVQGKENEIIVFKSCYPNTKFKGNPSDKANTDSNPPRNFSADSEFHTIANAKRTYNDILNYCKSRPDKFFVFVTPPPRLELPENGRIARGFATWLNNDWLKESSYQLNNVMVFDLYNVLTSGLGSGKSDLLETGGNHHRIWEGKEQHVIAVDNHLLVYPRKPGDNHPSSVGLQKATAEFVPLLLEKYRQWRQGASR